MKFLQILLFLSLVNCINIKNEMANQTLNTYIDKDILLHTDISQEKNSDDHRNEKLSEPLILGGNPYLDFEGKAYRKDEANLFSSLVCDFRPDSKVRFFSLEGLEQLTYLKSLSILGDNLDTVDFSPITYLYNLQELFIFGNIKKLPNLTKLEKIQSIIIKNAALENLEGIGAPNVEYLEISILGKEIDSLAPLNNLLKLKTLDLSWYGTNILKIADISNLPSLKQLLLYLFGIKIDLQGIEFLSSLTNIRVSECEPFNIDCIGKLNKLERLSINLILPQPSLEFIRGMINLNELILYADGNREGFPRETEAYQILDMTPLATLEKLNELTCVNFIIKNISILDDNEAFSNKYSQSPSGINLWRSRLYDETEKSRHFLTFELQSG